MEEKDGIKAFYPKDRAEWRAWLAENHATETRVWLIMYRKQSGMPSIQWTEAVDEALCYGWIDSKVTKRDDDSRYQFFSKRKPKGTWSAINKQKVDVLAAQNLIMEAGWAAINLAKENGSWDTLNEVDQGIIPDDLQAQFEALPGARENFDAFSPSIRKNILYWIASAKQPETRAKRILETATLAARNEKANQYVPKK